MTVLAARPGRLRDRLFEAVTNVLAILLLPIAFVRRPGNAAQLACQWALGLRFPAENLDGLTVLAKAAFQAARTDAFWCDGQLIGLTSGHRDAAEQHQLFNDEVVRTGSVSAARRHVLPPEESTHVKGIAMDVRPVEGARWLEDNGWRYDLYRTYDNEWWHFEHRPQNPGQAPRRLPHPGWTSRPYLVSSGETTR
ncbi:D,D-peptidase/D,D-carboxypeptidase VanY-N [Fodinicola feengrottensis]|uniref:D-alanyl-D-alanine carboxypeptidase-like core domain-containing protein n=1 Tax=Fodinicola feengrottensis TaxID=435914 RepID=A0ABN2G7X9_9ACTN|nr:D,D-peptidase/D,D-carboxypeptidase VanY-N [Fodinicola feengrottensis]